MTRFFVALSLIVVAIFAASLVNANPDATACNATLPDGVVFDLSPLTNMDLYGNDTRDVNKTKSGFDYYVRFCSNVTNSNCTTNKKNGMVCQIDEYCALCGFEISGPGAETPINWTYANGRDSSQGLVGVAKRNGDACPAYNIPNRGAVFHLMCGQPTVPPLTNVTESNCTYTISMTTCQACRNPSTCSNEMDGSSSSHDGTIDFTRLDDVVHSTKLHNKKGKRWGWDK